MQALTTTAARYIFILPFAVFGIFHFMNASQMAGMVPIPGGVFWVYLTGLAHILAVIAFITGKQAKLAALLLAVMLAIFALSVQLPGAMGGDASAMSAFLKDVALAGGALTWAGKFDTQS